MNNILCWNIRGLNKARKQQELANFIANHNVSLFGFLETKVKRNALGPLYLRLCNNWCFTHNLVWHKGGCIIIGWKGEEMKVSIRECNSQVIHLEVHPLNGTTFFCSFVYGATAPQERLQLFQQLESIGNHMNRPWIILGDFNCVAGMDERIGHEARFHETTHLQNCMFNCGVHDIKFSGRIFTWSNKRVGQSRVMFKLDRVLGNQHWDDSFNDVEVIFLPEDDYDHTPMLVRFIKAQSGKKLFRFFNMWAHNDKFLDMVKEKWTKPMQGIASYQINQKLQNLKRVFRNNFHTNQTHNLLRETNQQLEQVQNLIHLHPLDPNLTDKESMLLGQIRKLKDYSSYLSRRAKISSIQHGDDNTKYFHDCIKQRRSLNKIHTLQLQEGITTTYVRFVLPLIF